MAIMLACVTAIPARADDPPPLPFDAKKAKALNEQDRAWALKTTLGAYKTIGKRNPKWDAHVEKAFQLNAERMHGSIWTQRETEEEMRKALDAAIATGCDDPMVAYYVARSRLRPADGSKNDEIKKARLDAARGLSASKYPPARKAHAWSNAIAELHHAPAGQRPGEEDAKLALQFRDELLKVLAELAKDKDPNARKEFLDVCHYFHRHGEVVGQRKEWQEKIQTEVFSKLPKNGPIPHAIAGDFWIKYAWDARGRGLADTVSEENFKLFHERLKEAEKSLTTAWELDNNCAEASADMVTVCFGLGHERDVMEKWFRRTVEADPNHPEVFQAKLEYLHPKWHGSVEELMEFARQVAKLERWDSLLAITLMQKHHDLASLSRDIAGYFRKQPAVWKEIEPGLEELRKRYPISAYASSLYLYYAWISNQNAKQAHEYVQAQKLELSMGRFQSDAMMKGAMKWAKEGAEKAGEK